MLIGKRTTIIAATGLIFFVSGFALAESIIVAAYDSTAEAKSIADYVCTGSSDQVMLLQSINRATTGTVELVLQGGQVTTVSCKVRHSVLWLPGTYNLSAALVIPDSSDCVINAEGTWISGPSTGTAVIIRGMNRCDYRFGIIKCNSESSVAAALRISPVAMPAMASYVNYSGLQGTNKRGVGLYLVADSADIFSNNIIGTNIQQVGTGIMVDAYAPHVCSSNRFWISYIIWIGEGVGYGCIRVKGSTAQKNIWNVNVEASGDDSFAIRTAGSYDKWYVILGTAAWWWYPVDSQCRSLILDPGASHNVLDFHPAVEDFAPIDDSSGNSTNVILSVKRPPYSE